jgi:hypothetical protein
MEKVKKSKTTKRKDKKETGLKAEVKRSRRRENGITK